MKAHLFKQRKKNERTGYWNTSFWLQGVGLNGLVPIRVCYFGKPVMEPEMVKDVDLAGKPKKDKDGNDILIEKKDKDGNVVLKAKVDEHGEPVLRDEDFSVRVEVLEMYSGDYKAGIFCEPVDVEAKAKSSSSEGDDKFNYFVTCGALKIPVEVPDFSTDERPDYSFRANRTKLHLIATQK